MQGFAGADYSAAGRANAGPVAFEREPGAEEDMFGLDKFMSEMRSGSSRKDKKGALDHIGQVSSCCRALCCLLVCLWAVK